MKNQFLIIAVVCVLIVIGIFSLYFFANKKIDSQNSNLVNQQEPIIDVVKLCETENPRFNPTEECQKVINEKYSNKECTFEFGPTEWLPLGSCRNCTITCK